MNSMNLIEGKVARVLTSRDLVLNRGAEHGVNEGMIFEVLDPEGSDIPDPDTGEVIGSVYRPKVRVRVEIVEPKLAVAKTYRKRRINVGGTGGIDISQMLSAPRWKVIPETFKSEDAEWERISEGQSIVKVGDPVRQIPPSRQKAEVEEAEAS
jgi:hypothetical protein